MKKPKFVLPKGKSEAEVLDSIEKAVRMLAPNFVFGHYSLEDVKQEARIFGLECLEKYDRSRPLDNFVYVHIHNRLINLLRNKLRRNDYPCEACHTGTPCQADGSFCKKYAAWLRRNTAKANLMQPLSFDIHCTNERQDCERGLHTEATAEHDATQAELLELIDVNLPVELRGAYNKIREGVSVPKAKRQEVFDAVNKILNGVVECPAVDE